MPPPDSLAAAVAPYHEAGLPIRIAVATVWGFFDDVPLDDGRGTGGLKPEHARQLGGHTAMAVFAVPLPVRGDVARVTHRDAVHVGGIAERIDDFECARLLPVDAIRVHGIHHRHRRRSPRRRTMVSASSKLPSTWMTLAPCTNAWASFPSAMAPSGMSTAQLSPARAA